MLAVLASPFGLVVDTTATASTASTALGLPASRALLSRATELPVYITAAADRQELFALAEAAEAEALAFGTTPQWPRDASALCQRWRLIATTKTAGSELLQQMARQPALGTFRVAQNWKEREADGALRCDNVISVGRPNGGLLSAWTLLQAGGQSSLTLQHKAKVLQDGTAAQQPLRIAIELDAVVLGGNRQAGEPEEPILQLPFPPALLPGLPPPPSLPMIPGLAAALEEVGTVEVTVLDEQLRVVRGVAGARADVLRVFIRDDAGGGALPTW